MTERAEQLHATADEQIVELIALVATLDDTTMHLPCPGREKLGDGTIAAATQHTADNYQRIASFVQTSDLMTSAGAANGNGRRVPGFIKALGHRPRDHVQRGHGSGPHDDQYTADNADLGALLEQLSASREALGRMAELTDSQLDVIPPDGSFRFCDGQRTLEHVLASLLKHQSHQLDSLKAASA
jgi:hypothetical protein